MRMIIVGAGELSRRLVSRLGEAWDVTIVDSSETRLGEVGPEVRAIHGDGSSRLTLNEAGLEEADALVAATDDDEANLEICRLALDARVRRVVAVTADADRLPAYRELEVPAFSPAELTARQVEVHLEPRRGTSKTFAEGRVEAMEFRVAANSPMRGRSLRDLAGEHAVATVLRAGTLHIADGSNDLQLEPGDVVTLMGSATELPTIVRGFTAAAARFPLDHGKRVAVALTDPGDLRSTYREAVAITRNSRASSLLALLPTTEDDERDALVRGLEDQAESESEGIKVEFRPARHPERDILRLPETESIGILVIRQPTGPFRRFRHPVTLARRLGTPVLYARGKRTHQRILVAARRSAAGRAAAQAAVDLAEIGKAELSALAVVDPQFMAGPDAEEEAALAVDQVKELAAVHGVEVHQIGETGNPVAAFLRASERTDLIVLGLAERSLSRPTLASKVALDATASVLVVPTKE